MMPLGFSFRLQTLDLSTIPQLQQQTKEAIVLQQNGLYEESVEAFP
jgi:hypothetical protein